jgi:cob(I)alamin adenosyltransferase
MSELSKIYTKTGDDGTSGLIGGTRVEKFDNRLEAYGTVDELNSWIGLIKTGKHEEKVMQTLIMIQNKLFVIGSQLATDITKTNSEYKVSCNESDIQLLESEIDRMLETLPELNNFILPGGTTIASYCHVARTVCRRAERRITLVARENIIPDLITIFINRLSDYLFVLSRYINYYDKQDETIWTSIKS